MRKLKLFFACLLMAVLSIGQVWADPAAVGTTLFSEDFSGYSADNVPSGSVSTATGRVVYGSGLVTYTSTNGTGTKPGTTKIWNESTGGGTAPEILVGKQGTSGTPGSFKIAGIPSGGAQEITVSWTQNAQKLTGSLTGTGYSTTYNFPKPSATGTVSFDITVADGADATFDLTLTASSSNVRVDDILITVKTAGEGGAPAPTLTGVTVSGTPTKKEYSAGDNFDPAGLTVTGTYDIGDPATITSGITWTACKTESGTYVALDDEAVALAKDETGIYVKATVSEITSAAFHVTGLSVTEAPTTVTFDYADYKGEGTQSDGSSYTMEKTQVSIGDTKFYGNNSYAHFYAGGVTTITPAAGVTITKVVLTASAEGYNGYQSSGTVTASAGSLSHDGVVVTWTGSADEAFTISHNKQIRWTSIVVFYEQGEAPAVDKPTISGETPFLTSTTVTLTQDAADAIYYTTDEAKKENPSVDTWTVYNSASKPSYSATTTIYAAAIKGSAWSAVAEKTFTKLEPLTTMDAIFAAATAAGTTATDVAVTFNNWVVTGVKSSNAYVTDGTKGFIIYTSSHGFNVGDIISGTAACKVQLYNGSAELTELPATKVTVNTGGSVSPVVLDADGIAALTGANTGSVIKISGECSEESSKFYIGGVQLYNSLYSFSVSAGTSYECTGIYVLFNSTKEILPRSAADIVETSTIAVTGVDMTESTAEVEENETVTLHASVAPEDATNKTIVWSVESGDTYASVDQNGVVTGLTAGTAVIRAASDENASIYEECTVTVTAADPTKHKVTFDATADKTTEDTELSLTKGDLTIAITDGDGRFNNETDYRVYKNSVFTVSCANGNITKVELTCESSNPASGFGTVDPAGLNTTTGVWTGNAASVTFTADVKQVRINTITVTYKEDNRADAGISFEEESYPATIGVDFTAPELQNQNNVTVTYSSSNENLALVDENNGEVLIGGTEGTVTITATFAGNEDYKPATASYDIVISAATPTPVYTMSFDMTRASYDDAADAQVVWNSNVVTMTADQNDGTKVTNYLAGNYSGTTLIAESRFYAKNSISFVPQAGVTITKIEWMSTAKGYATKLAAETFVNATAVVDGTDDKLVIITPSAAGEISVTLTDAARATGVTVYYQAESEKAPLTASIAIDNISMETSDPDILLTDIEATSNPNKKAISYAVTSGNEYVSITGEGPAAAFHALAEGTATITATIPDDLGNYTGATTTFNIEVSAPSKVDPALAYTPNELEIEAADIASWSAPAFSNTYSVSPITYTSSTPSVAKVTDAGVITLEGGYGTAVITAHFEGDEDYLESTATYTITVIEPADVCDGTDDFLDTEDTNNPTSYKDRSTPNGWSSINAGYKVIDEKAYWMINGKTTAVGVITSPELTGGLGTLKFRYANTNSESNGVSVKIEIKQGEDVVKEYTLTKPNSEVVQNTVYTELIENINVAGTFQIVITNLSPSNNTGNKDRVSIGRFCWSSYTAPEPPAVDYTEVRIGLNAGEYYTMCLDKAVTAVKGGTIWRVVSKSHNGANPDIILEDVDGTLDAGRPYIFRAAASTLEVAYTGDAVGAPVTEGNNGLVGSFSQVQIAYNAHNYIIYNNALYLVNSDKVYVGANRAYLNMDAVPDYNGSASAPGRRRITMTVHNEQTTTDIDALNASETPVKMIINGQLFIIRGEKMFDATGRLVK